MKLTKYDDLIRFENRKHGEILLSEKGVRGLFGVFIDVLTWLRIYRQRDFWIQIAAVIVGVLLWVIILPSEEEIARGIAAAPILIFLNAIMTNIVWVIFRKPYSCVIGGSVGYGLYNFAIAVIVYHLSFMDILLNILLGVVYGFVFTWFAFIIFYFIGLIKIRKKEEPKASQT
jgi:hypothetical protein